MNDTQIATIDERPPATASDNASNVLALIQHGLDRGMTPEALTQLVALQERIMAKQAEQAFFQAKKQFQAECPVIGKNRDVSIDKGPKYRFADLEKITTTIAPLLERHGFSYDFAQRYDKEIIEVTCYLRHDGGHTQATSFSAPWATNAGMSGAQKSASATTFCQRYALRLALGLPVGEDDDARPPADVPPQRTDAPAPRTRNERNTAPEVTSQQIGSVIAEWKANIGGPDGDKADFATWCLRVCPGEWEPGKQAAWTRERFVACMTRLGVPPEVL
jgi:hypothetical protein